MMKAIVLSNQEQFEKFMGLGLPANEVLIFCDNERLYDFLKKRDIRFEKLDEFHLKDRWEEINRWGIGEAAEWIRICKDHNLFKVYDYASVIFLWFSVILISAVKSYLYASYIIKKHSVDELYVFCGEVNDKYPELSGNATLNYFIRDIAAKNGRKIHLLELSQIKEPLFKTSLPFLKLKRFLRGIAEEIYAAAVRPRRIYELLAFGTLRHLASTMLQLKKQGCRICFYDEAFHFDHFCFSLKAGIPYFVQSCFMKGIAGSCGSALQNAPAELTAALEHPACRNLFQYQMHDFKDFIRGKIFGNMAEYFKRLSKEEAIYKRILKTLGLSGVLLDEDFNAHSFFAEFMKKTGVQNFCISHANMSIDCVVPETARHFAQSYTFVHGQQEKDTYVDRGWDPEMVLPTGTPRYDQLKSLISNVPRRVKGPATRILFCGAYLWPSSPDILGFIGCDIYAYRYFQELAIRALLEASRNMPLIITVKPHYSEDEVLWKQLVAELKPDCPARVAKASEDFFTLLAESDAIMLCPWSSTLIEAGISGVPALYFDPEHQDSGHVRRLEESGLCRIVRNAADLRTSLKSLCEKDEAFTRPEKLSASQAYYLGDLRARANLLVAEFILKKIRGEAHVAV